VYKKIYRIEKLGSGKSYKFLEPKWAIRLNLLDKFNSKCRKKPISRRTSGISQAKDSWAKRSDSYNYYANILLKFKI
jgi:hypothetical protein